MTNFATDMRRSDSNRSPLGQLLVDAGLLSSADLQKILEQQVETGLPLGRMLVDGGYVPAHSVAMALAEQHGGLLKTEYGFATGHRRSPSTPSIAANPGTLAEREPPGQDAPVAPPHVERLDDLGGVPDPIPSEAEGRLLSLGAELVDLRARLGAAEGRCESAEVARKEALDELAGSQERIVELADAAAAQAARCDSAELARKEALDELAGSQERIVQLESAAAAQGDTLQSAQHALERALAELESERERARPREVSRRIYSDDRHILFVPSPSGYAVVVRSGPPPAVGTDVEMSGDTRFKVVRVGPSPLLDDPHPHVYLDRIEPSWSA